VLALDNVLGLLAEPAPTPAGGSAAAVTAAIASSLVVMVGRGSPAWPEGENVASRATVLRTHLMTLAEEDVVALASLLELMRNPADGERDERLSSACLAASGPAVAIVESASEIAELAKEAEANGKRIMRADAAVARELATAAASSALRIVETNLAAARDEATRAGRSLLLQRARSAAQRTSTLAP